VDLRQQSDIRRLLGVVQGRLRAVEADLTGLRLRPTDADIAALAADGYVGEVLAELRDAQDEESSAEALNILAGLLMERQA
jgi:hypothetical protein